MVIIHEHIHCFLAIYYLLLKRLALDLDLSVGGMGILVGREKKCVPPGVFGPRHKRTLAALVCVRKSAAGRCEGRRYLS